MTSLQRRACLIGLTGALVLSASGCDPYTYFNVHISIQKPQATNAVDDLTQRQINACTVFVLADGKKIENPRTLTNFQGTNRCLSPGTPEDLGTMDYSTTRSSGELQFIVSMYDSDTALSSGGKIIVQGTTTGTVNPGHVQPTLELVGKLCNDTALLTKANEQGVSGAPDCNTIQ